MQCLSNINFFIIKSVVFTLTAEQFNSLLLLKMQFMIYNLSRTSHWPISFISLLPITNFCTSHLVTSTGVRIWSHFSTHRSHGLNIPIQCLNTPIQCLNTPIQCLNTPIQCLNTPIQCLNTPIQCLNTPIPCLNTPIPWSQQINPMISTHQTHVSTHQPHVSTHQSHVSTDWSHVSTHQSRCLINHPLAVIPWIKWTSWVCLPNTSLLWTPLTYWQSVLLYPPVDNGWLGCSHRHMALGACVQTTHATQYHCWWLTVSYQW